MMDVKQNEKTSFRKLIRKCWKSRSTKKKTPTHSSASIKRHPTQEPVPAYISEKELCPKRETETTTTAPKNSFLWDEAYDILKKENPILVTEYEELLLRLEDETKPTLSEPRQVIIDAKTKIPQHDVLARRQMLQDIALFNLQKSQEGKLKTTFFGKQIVWQEAIGKFGLGVRWVQDYTRDALKDVPYAPIVMVAVALLLPLLTGPFTADSENHEGLLYVVSQIKYYIKMETLMLPDCLDAGVKSELNEQVKSLYKLVIEFQVQSVMRFDRSPTKNYIRSVIDYESWSTRLDLIKESEKTIRNNMQGAASWTIVQKLENLKQEAQDSRKTVEEIAHTTQKIEQHMSDAEYRRCLDTLKASGFELDKESIQDFKGGLLKDSYQWVVENHDFKRWMAARSGQLLWIKGDPGKGKTMLLCGIVDELSHMANSCTNIAFAFCQANKETRNNASAVLRGLIYMLVKQQPSLITSISEESFSGDNAWFALQRAFINILNNPELQASYLVIDGLDECIEGRHRLLKLLVNHSSAHPNVKWVVSSRNWPEIEQDLDQATEMKLHLELNEEVLSTAIQSFITYKVDDLRTKKKDRPEIWKAVHDHLLANAKGTFLWVALVWKHLTEVPWWKVTEKLKEFPPGLDQIYERMMGQIKKLDDADLYKSVLRVSTTVLRPITLDEMMVYLDVPENSVEVLEEIVRGCGSFLSLQGNTVLLVHQSAKDFLLTQASGEVYPCGKDKAQHDIYSSSMHLLKGALRRDIYDLRAPGYPVEQIEVPCPDPLLAVRYACAHWIDHLLLCNDEGLKIELQEDGLVSRFFSQNYLHWLEVMSIMKSLPAAIKSIRKLEKSLETAGEPKALMLQVKDAVRFVQYTQFAIERSPLQVYYSSLMFSPKQSMTRQCYHDRDSKTEWILKEPEAEEDWSPCLQTLQGHGLDVISIAWSGDGSRLVSTCETGARIWELDSGQCSLILEDWLSCQSPVSWFDANRVAFVTSKGAVKVWHLDTGQSVAVLEAQESLPSCMAWSPDGSRFALVRDKAIHVIQPGVIDKLLILKRDMNRVSSISWSPDGNRIASSDCIWSVDVWDLQTKKLVSTLERTHQISCSAWSPDGSLLALGAKQGVIQIWDPQTWSLEFDIDGDQTGSIASLAWSPDGFQLASGSDDKSITIWDLRTMKCCATLEGHTESVHSIAWSPDGSLLASGAFDDTIKIWDVTTQNDLAEREHDDSFMSIEYNHDSSQLAASRSNNTVYVWNHVTGQCTICEGHTGWVNDVAWSPDGSQLASASHDGTVRVWDPVTGQFTILDGHTNYVLDVAWSSDGSKLASASHDGTVRVWNLITGDCICLQGDDLQGNEARFWSVAWYHDGGRIASADAECMVRVWDLATSQCTILEGHTDYVEDVAWSHDGSQLVSASWDGTVRVWDLESSQCVRVLPLITSGFLYFDNINSNELHTGQGKLDLRSLKGTWSDSEGSTDILKPSGYGLGDDCSWITYDGNNVIWLPPEYRPRSRHALAISDTAMTIGCLSGRGAMLRFSTLNPLKDL